MAAAHSREVARLQSLVDRFGAKQSKAAQAHSWEKRIERIEAERVDSPLADRAISVRFPPPPHSGRVTLEVDGLTKGYGGPPVFEDINFDVPRGERLLVLGLNGVGKTSLLRILAGETVADDGSFRFATRCRPGTTPRSTTAWWPTAPCSITCASRPACPTPRSG